MKTIFLSLILILLSLLVQAQKQDAHFTIDCSHYSTSYNKQLCTITEKSWSAIVEKNSYPKDSLGNSIDKMHFDIKNSEIISKLVREIFTKEEIEILKKRKFRAWFLMNDNGDICSVQYDIYEEDNIDLFLNGLEKLANSFKEKLIVEVEFYPEVAQSGVFFRGFSVFDDRIWVE